MRRAFFERFGLLLIPNAEDIDTLDSESRYHMLRTSRTHTSSDTLGDALRMVTFTMSQIIGAIILIAIVLPWFLVPVTAIILVYYFSGMPHCRRDELPCLRNFSPVLPCIGARTQSEHCVFMPDLSD